MLPIYKPVDGGSKATVGATRVAPDDLDKWQASTDLETWRMCSLQLQDKAKIRESDYQTMVLDTKVLKMRSSIYHLTEEEAKESNKELIHAYGPEKKVIIMPINKTIERIKRTAA